MTLIPFVIAAALSAGNAEFDETANCGALNIVTVREGARLRAEGPAKGSLKERMLSAPGEYLSVAKAKSVAKEDYRRLALAEYNRVRTEAAARFGLKREEISDPSVFLTGDWEKVFERRFAEERKAACDEQAKGIAAKVKPSEADFGRKDESVIRAELEGAVIGQRRASVFEENRKYISEKIVGPIMASAKGELNRQRDYLKRTRCESYAPSVLEKELAANLERNVRDRKGKGAGAALEWEVFPVVIQEGVRKVAEKRTLDRVAHAIDDVEMQVDAALLRSKIAGDRDHHRRLADSEQAFRTVFASLLTGKALEKVVADAPAAERDEFRQFVMARSGEASLGKAVEARVKRELLPRIREVRGEIAAEDAAEIWPTLMDGTWYPEPSLADDICARSDFSKLVKKWRGSPELAMLAKKAVGKVMIEETDRLADAKVAAAFELARNAINAQNAVLDRAAPLVTEDAKKRQAGWFSRSPDMEKIVEMLTAEVESGWHDSRDTVLWGEGERPANADEQHCELFPSVRKRIELMAKTILEELKKPEQEEKPLETPPEDPPPEEATPEETPPENPPPEEIEFTLSIKKSGDRLEARILQGTNPVFEKSCPAKQADFRRVSALLIDKLVEVLGLR